MNRTVILALLALLLLIVIPASFAEDNGTEILSYETTDDAPVVSLPLEEDTLGAGEVYFNASAESDGDGSASNPYKYLRATRIQSNCNLHFANGEYQLDTYKYIDQVNIIGSDVDKTIIKYDGVAFRVNNMLTVKNITFIGASITNYAKFNATNTVFEDGYGSKPDSYGNNYGGAIFTDKGSANAYVNVDNCTFKNNYAVYGGAIFMGSGNLNVYNSLFFNNCAYNYGGAIACEHIANVTISKSKFFNSESLADAGGSIYIKNSSKLNADHVDIVNSSSTFGGAITTLNTDVSLSYVNMADNSAEYDGGAIFHMYGTFSLTYSTFDNNSACNGGALFIDNSTSVFVRSNTFTNNKATNTGGAIYSLLNHLESPYSLQNRYSSNNAAHSNDYFDTSAINLTIGSGNYTMYKVDINSTDSLPSRYSLVDEGYITSIKDQQTSGNCWAFTAIAVLESCISKANGGLLDLSEENMKNIIALYSDYGWSRIDTNNGGYDSMPWGYLAAWLGPVEEMDDLFDDRSTLSPVLNSIMHVQNIKFLERSSYTDNDEIKKAILNYGAVGTGIYQDSYYLNSATNAYYCWYSENCDHAVTIVGWDDDFSRNNFRWGSTAVEGDGAWIVRNSWGSSWGDDGYYYVSYYDRNFARPGEKNTAYTIILNDTVRLDKNYQYDIAGMTDYFMISSPSVWYKNVFTASSDEYLEAVSTYFEKACNWTASVLVNGELKDVMSGTTGPGYYTFDLNRYISLKSGDVFEVIFNVTTSGGASFPISEKVSLNKLVYAPQTSYLSYDGVNWQDLYNLTWTFSGHTYDSQVACIKAFTYFNPIATLTNLSIDFIEENGILNISAIIADEFGNLVKYGNVTFSINGENQSVNVVKGKASFLYGVNDKVNSISATFDGEGYDSSSNATVYTVPKISAEISLEISQSFNNVTLMIMVNRLINETISVEINGNKTFLELINGSKTLILENLSNDNYDVVISLLEGSDYEAAPVICNFTISLSKTAIVAEDLTTNDEKSIIYNVVLIDESNNPVPDKEIVFTINNSTYANRTDENGQATLVLDLSKGVYDIEMAFDGDNDYFKSDTKNTITVKGKVWIDLDIATYKNIAFINVHGSNIVNETFTVLVNDEPNYIDAKNGSAHLQLRNLSMGVYNVTALLDESEYDFNDATSQFTIDAGAFIEITSGIEMSGDDLLISIEIANATGSVVVIVDGNSDAVKLNDSKANYTVSDIAPGNHSIVIVYDDELLGEIFKYEIFNVPKKDSSVELIFNDTKVGQKSAIIVNVAPGACGLVSVDINGTQYLVNLSKTNVLEVTFDNAGEYPIFATYLGDDYYKESSSGLKVLTVDEKSPANIRVELPSDIKVGDEFTINVTSDSSALLIVMVNGNEIVAEGPLTASLGNILKVANAYKYVADKAGIYNLTVFAHETDDFASEIYSESFYVSKKDAKLDIAPIVDVKLGDKITVDVENDTDGALTVKINGETVKGEYELIKAGSYTVTVESAPTDGYTAGFASYTFNVDEEPVEPKQEAEITIDAPNDVQSGNNISVTVSITNATGNVTVIVDGEETSVALRNGTVAIPIESIAGGNHSVVVIYHGDDKHNGAYKATTFNVVDEPVEPETNMTVIVDGKEYVAEIINGTAVVTTDPVPVDNHAVIVVDGVEYPVEIVNGTAFVDTNRTEPEMPSSIIVDGVEYPIAYVNGTATVTTDPVPVDNHAVIVVDGVEYPVEIVNGTATIVTNRTEPDNNITVVVDGVSFPAEVVNGTATVTTDPIAPAPVTPSVNVTAPSQVAAGDASTVKVELPSDAAGNVTVKVDGKEVANVPIANGVANVPLFALGGGTHAVEVIYTGDSKYAATTAVSTISAEKKATHIEIDSTFTRVATDFNAGERGANQTGYLLDEDGNPVVNRTVQIAVNGIIYNKTTDENGKFYHQINLAAANTYTYALVFSGDELYNASLIASSKLTVTKKATSISASNKAFKATAKTKTINVTLKTIKNPYDGNTYLKKGKKITLKINGVTYTAKTNANGVAKFSIKLIKKGKFVAKVTFAGDNTYKASSKSIRITIK